jgi:hypothetical protein
MTTVNATERGARARSVSAGERAAHLDGDLRRVEVRQAFARMSASKVALSRAWSSAGRRAAMTASRWFLATLNPSGVGLPSRIP